MSTSDDNGIAIAFLNQVCSLNKHSLIIIAILSVLQVRTALGDGSIPYQLFIDSMVLFDQKRFAYVFVAPPD